MGCGIVKSLKKSSKVTVNRSTDQLTCSDSPSNLSKALISNGYKPQQFLPSLGTAKIILISHEQTSEKYIAKVLRKDSIHKNQLGPDKKPLETSLLPRLQHENIIKFVEVFQDKEHFFEIFEHCEGGDLYAKLLGIGVFLEADAAVVVFQLLLALEYMHAHNFLHREVKIDNVLLKNCYDLEVRLGGFSRVAKNDKTCVSIGSFGIANSLPPEVYQGKYTEKSDIWACGIITYMLLTGKVLEVKGKPGYKNWSSVEIEQIADTSSMVHDFIKGLLEANPDERFSAQEALAHPWIVTYKNKNSYLTLPKPVAIGPRNKLVRGLMLFVITCLIGKDTLTYLGDKFRVMNHSPLARTARQEFEDMIKRTITQTETGALVSKIFENLCFDKPCRVDLTEFLISFAETSSILTEENLSLAFEHIDSNSDKIITFSDLESTIGTVDMKAEENFKIKELFEGEKKIGKEEFISLVKELL